MINIKLDKKAKNVISKTADMGEGGTTVIANPELSGDEANLTGLQVGETKYKVPQGGGNNGHTLTVQFSSVWDDDEGTIAGAEYQVFKVVLLKYLNGNVVTSIETINDNNEHTFENVIAYTFRYAGNKTAGNPNFEKVSMTGIICRINGVYNADIDGDIGDMIQLFTNSKLVGEYLLPLPE